MDAVVQKLINAFVDLLFAALYLNNPRNQLNHLIS